MTKTSSSDIQIQTGHQEDAAEQSPPLITDQGGDQKAENDGCKRRVDEQGAEDMWKIDVRNGEERESNFCRICQLSSDDHLQPGAGNISLVHLGCSCKGELGVSHYCCAQAWFMQKGNRTCEICGKAAKNIEGVEETRVQRLVGSEVRVISMNSSTYENDPGCGKFLCNFLLVAVIMAFLLPWVFHPSKLS